MDKKIYVYFDAEMVEGPVFMGTLTAMSVRGKEVFSFEYDRSFILDRRMRSFDADLQLVSGHQYAPQDKSNFGIFLDSTPDRWGRVLLDKREVERGKEEQRPARSLREVDYLLGLFDGSRMGALRFKLSPDGNFLDDDAQMATPPWTSIRSLESAVLHLENDNEVQSSKWLKMLVAPGSSLGGARPKANVLDAQGNLWIAKFPSRKDTRDEGAWEAVCMQMAASAGITVSESRAERFGSSYHTFLTRRFDRTEDGRRRMFASAMTLLGHTDGKDGVSYLEIAEWIMANCTDVDGNLRELFRRIAFNIAISNCDDHLRNHGFIFSTRGWYLSPAYDLTPDPTKDGLKLNIDEVDNSLDFNLLLSTAPYYGLSTEEAGAIVERVRKAVSGWRMIALGLGIPRHEQELMSKAFSRAALSEGWDHMSEACQMS